MHKSLTTGRRLARARRRGQIRRRRAVALVAFLTLIVLAVWAAYAIPSQVPARIPASAALASFGESPAGSDRVVVATLDGVEVLMPVPLEATTAVAYHSVENPNTVPFSPAGERVSGGGLGTRLASIFASGGGLQYHLMEGSGDDVSSSTSGLAVGAVPGADVLSPVSGKVIAVKKYEVLGRYKDVEIDLQVADDPSLVLVITHVTGVKVQIGDVVRAGDSTLGKVRGFAAGLDQCLKRYTSDAGDHVGLVALRVTPDIAGL